MCRDPFEIVKAVMFSALLVFAIFGLTRVHAEENSYENMRGSVNEMVHETAGDFCSSVTIEEGVMLTAKHCVTGLPVGTVYVRQDGKLLPIGQIIRAADRDLARVVVPGLHCPCAPLAPKMLFPVGTEVWALGYPRGGDLTVTTGFYIGVADIRPEEGEVDEGRYVITTAPIKPGNSGGGLFAYNNADGKFYLIGVCSWGAGPALLFGAPSVIAGFVPVGA